MLLIRTLQIGFTVKKAHGRQLL